MVSTAMMASMMLHALAVAGAGKATNRIRSRAANAAALVAVAIKAVTAVGEPSYTSGVHWWKGTAAILNSSPTRIRPMATKSRLLAVMAGPAA